MQTDDWPLGEGEFRLHRLSEQQAPGLSALMGRIYPPIYQYLWPDQGQWYLHHAYGSAAIIRDLQQPDSPYWLMQRGEESLGVLRLQLHAPLSDELGRDALQLHRIYLAPEIIGQGLGQQLLTFTQAMARRLGKEVLWLEVMDSQLPAIRFYEKCGFRPCGAFRLPYEQMYPHFRGMLRMKLDL